MVDAGLPLKDSYHEVRHEIISHGILRRHGFDKSVAVIIGGHHGKPPDNTQLSNLQCYDDSCGFDSIEWKQAQDLLLSHALEYAKLTHGSMTGLKIKRPAQVLLSGIIILADWIASDTDIFPLLGIENSIANSTQRANQAFDKLKLPALWEPDNSWSNLYYQRFEIDNERPVQTMALRVAQTSPDIMIIEAPMGEGKTEAALAAAEIMARKAGCRGIYFALPTQATSNAMFKRIKQWLDHFDYTETPYSIHLVHGKAALNDDYRVIPLSHNVHNIEGDEVVVIHEWLTGRKKDVLSDFVVGTIDHVLMAGLKQKHLVLRHLGLAGKVVIIDEVHAYDVYMNSYLIKALKWLGAHGVPVIVLSATLPAERRSEIMEAYTTCTVRDGAITTANGQGWAESRAYPLITYANGNAIAQCEVQGERPLTDIIIKQINDDELVDLLDKQLSNGGCAGVIVNTVRRAQKLYTDISERFCKEDVRLLHAGLLAIDRSNLEQQLIKSLGPPDAASRPKKLIVIGTQILEQSLDFDFDILATDLCPIDLLLQRTGRLHRHERQRPALLKNPLCLVMGAGKETFESGAEAIYGKYLLMRTQVLLPEHITLPSDIPDLISGVYSHDSLISSDNALHQEYIEACKEWGHNQKSRKIRAEDFQISDPVCAVPTLIGWLDTAPRDDSEKRGEAAVRDGDSAIEVIVVMRKEEGIHLLPWIENGRIVPHGTPERSLAEKIASCSVRLPAKLSKNWIVDNVVKELEEIMSKEGLDKTWYQSPLLKGSLCLILDDSLQATLCNYLIKYDNILGLSYERGS